MNPALEDRIATALADHQCVTKRMFGGLCFMLRGNMLVGTFRDGFMARISKSSHADAIKLPGASPMEMKGQVMEGFILVKADAVADDNALRKWIGMALDYNATLPAKAAKKPAKEKFRA